MIALSCACDWVRKSRMLNEDGTILKNTAVVEVKVRARFKHILRRGEDLHSSG